MAEYGNDETPDSAGIWNWRTLDIGRVLERWGADGAGRAGARAPAAAAAGAAARDLGPLRRPGRRRPRLGATWVRASPTPRWAWSRPRRCDGSTSTSTTSAPRSTAAPTSAPSWPTSGWSRAAASGTGRRPSGSRRPASGVGWPSTRSGRAGYDVLGDLDSLLVPDELPERRTPETVTDAEVAAGRRRAGGPDAARRPRPAPRAPRAARGAGRTADADGGPAASGWRCRARSRGCAG